MTTSCGTRTVASDPTVAATDRSSSVSIADHPSSPARSPGSDRPVPTSRPGDTAPAAVRRVCHDALDTNDLIARFQEQGDCAALETVMARFDWLASACARRLRRPGEAIEDLEQVAREGLLGAVARFDVNRGASFKSFAWVTVLGALRHYYRSRWQVRIPRALQEMHLATVNAVEELTAAASRSPTIDELAVRVGAPRDEVRAALSVGHAYRVESLDHAPDDDGDGAYRERVLADLDEPIESVADRVDLRAMLSTLPPVQRTVLLMGFFEGKTQGEIGAFLGVSQVHVSRLMRAGLTGLREHVAAPRECQQAS